MTPGHFGLAAGVKKWTPTVPLWALFVSTYLLDILFVVLLAFGVEGLTPIDPAHPNAYGGVLIHANYTHSLLGAMVIAAIAGWLASRRWGQRGGIAIGAVAFSHWLLDLLVHRADLPILPGNLGNLPLLGLGWWDAPAISAFIELVLVLGGAYLYYRSAMQLANGNRRGKVLSASIVTAVLLLLLFITNTLGL